MFIFRVQRGRIGQRLIPDLLGQGVGVGRAVNKIFGCESVDDDWDGFNVKSVVQMGGGSTYGIITGCSETLGLVNL
jgi:hypothetical protein